MAKNNSKGLTFADAKEVTKTTPAKEGDFCQCGSKFQTRRNGAYPGYEYLHCPACGYVDSDSATLIPEPK